MTSGYPIEYSVQEERLPVSGTIEIDAANTGGTITSVVEAIRERGVIECRIYRDWAADRVVRNLNDGAFVKKLVY